jgi:hypothetical protein
MSHADNHFHIAELLLARIDGELCELLMRVNKEKNDDHSTFDKKWIPHLKTIAELVTMHSGINTHYSEHLIDMRRFKEMCITMNSIVSKFGILGMVPFKEKGLIPSSKLSDNRLKFMFEIALRVRNETRSNDYDIAPYNALDPYHDYKHMLRDDVTGRINLHDKTIQWIKWYIQTLQILISNFETIATIDKNKKNKKQIVENILKPGCTMFHITEGEPVSILHQLVQSATQLLHIKEHPGALDASSRTTIIDMIRKAEQIIRDGELANLRTQVRDMMSRNYDSKPTLEQKTYYRNIKGLHSGPYFHPNFTSLAAKGPYIFGNIGRPSFGSFGKAAEAAAAEAAAAEAAAAEAAAAEAAAAEAAASIIQRAYRISKKTRKGGKITSKKKNSRRINLMQWKN